jgi:hypothetical protein
MDVSLACLPSTDSRVLAIVWQTRCSREWKERKSLYLKGKHRAKRRDSLLEIQLNAAKPVNLKDLKGLRCMLQFRCLADFKDWMTLEVASRAPTYNRHIKELNQL